MTSITQCQTNNSFFQIEFPSILLPPSITSGSIVDITVSQNHEAERKSQGAFESLQTRILNTYGLHSPATPELRLRNATQTALVLEWDPIQLATSTLRSLSLYRNGSKAGNIPRPMDQLATKISGLSVDSEYTFQLVLKTSGGTYSSSVLKARTHKMTDLTGIVVTPGVLPEQLRTSVETTVRRIGAKLADAVRIDTTHFVCTEGRGRDWERAMEMSIPVVRPEWIDGCEREGKIVGVRGYYLDANPKHREIGSKPILSSAQTPIVTQTPPTPPAPEVHRPATRSHEETTQMPQEDGPGPEVPPTPPSKHDVPEDHGADDDEEEEEEDHEEENARKESQDTREQADSPVSPVSEVGDTANQWRKTTAEDEKEMDEVPL